MAPTAARYDALTDDGLSRAKLDVMAEIAAHMRELARPRGVAGWTRSNSGALLRERRKPARALKLIAAYTRVILYVARLKAKGRRGRRQSS
jgi:hypothetical protein